ncbi:hypothetical protein SUGI_0567790 [Cryptomeria japonica]|nr:hypothetical protein SUGI_0567790 [Cryptomeria japonica]
MGDPGLIPGMIGYAINLAANHVIQCINVAIRCRKELDALKVLLLKIQVMNMEMQEYRKTLNSGRVSTSFHPSLSMTVNSWLNELNTLVEEASDLAQDCIVNSYCRFFPRYKTSRKIRQLIENVEKHVASTPSVAFLHQLQEHVANQQVLQQIKNRMDSLNLHTSALTGISGDLFPSTSSAAPYTKYIEEALIGGQDSASTRMKELIHSQQHKSVSRFGLLGKGGAGKTLLLKRLFNSDQRLQNDGTQLLSSSLRLSYDALADVAGYGISLQLCFLYLAAFSEDEVIHTGIATNHWMGEGLVAGPDPVQTGEIYVNLLAERCLIEPIQKRHDGKVNNFRVHDVLRHFLAHQIAEKEENCFFKARKGLKEFPADDCRGHIRISLRDNSLTKVPKAFGAPYIRSLLLAGNTSLTEVPKEVIGSMNALRVLDLSRNALQSLPKNFGSLKNLVSLTLCSVPIRKLPYSVANLKNLQCLPNGISRLTSMEYLNAGGSRNIVWYKCRRGRLSITDLGSLYQLKRLVLTNNGEIIREGMLGNIKQMQSLFLNLTETEWLPHDMTAMSKLRTLWLACPQLIQMEDSLYGFQNLGYLRLFNCAKLKQLPKLQKLENLRHLQIVKCPNIEKFPDEFGKEGAFPKLDVFSMVEVEKIEQLPKVEVEALSSLKIFTIMKCEALQRFPECYWNLKSVEKIRVYGC